MKISIIGSGYVGLLVGVDEAALRIDPKDKEAKAGLRKL